MKGNTLSSKPLPQRAKRSQEEENKVNCLSSGFALYIAYWFLS